MKILHFIMGKANPNRPNGVNYVIHGLCKYFSKQGHDVKVIGLSKGMKDKYELAKRENFKVDVYNKFFGECFNTLKKEIEKCDIVHLHSVWQHQNIILGRYLKSINKPYVVTIHSGLTEDRIKQSNYYTKLLYHKLFQKYIFDNASGIHAITREEISDISKYTVNKNIFFVPNGVDTQQYKLKEKSYEFDNNINKKYRFGYLGRFGEEKNIKNLILAINNLSGNIKKSIECVLIGPIDKDAKKLQELTKKLNLDEVVIFAGPLYNEEKLEKLESLDFYIHPAYSDVVSIAAMEAMACGLPLVITRTSQVSYYYNSGAFLMMEPNVNEIRKTILEMLENKSNWNEMSKSSIKNVEDFFNWDNVVKMMTKEYERILND